MLPSVACCWARAPPNPAPPTTPTLVGSVLRTCEGRRGRGEGRRKERRKGGVYSCTHGHLLLLQCVYVSACLPVPLSVCPSVCLSVCLSVFLSVCLSICLPVCQSVSDPDCPPLCLPFPAATLQGVDHGSGYVGAKQARVRRTSAFSSLRPSGWGSQPDQRERPPAATAGSCISPPSLPCPGGERRGEAEEEHHK